MPNEVSYENTTTTDLSADTAVRKQEKEEAAATIEATLAAGSGLVAVTPNQDRTTKIADEWYELKKGVVIAVPEDVAFLLRNCNVVE